MPPVPRPALAGLAALLGLAAAPAGAVEREAFMVDTTAQLAALCATPPEDPLHAAAVHMCQGYLLGAHHFHSALVLAEGSPIYCPPAEGEAPSRDAVVSAFVSWVRANPDVGGAEALDGLMTWAETAYPCN